MAHQIKSSLNNIVVIPKYIDRMHLMAMPEHLVKFVSWTSFSSRNNLLIAFEQCEMNVWLRDPIEQIDFSFEIY